MLISLMNIWRPCQVSDAIRVRAFGSGPWIEGHVEAAWPDGNFFAWIFHIARDDNGWFVRRSFGREDGQTVTNYDDSHFDSFEELMIAAPTLLAELLRQR